MCGGRRRPCDVISEQFHWWHLYWLTCLLTYLLTYLLTPRSTDLPEILTGTQIVKKFPAFYGTRKFIMAITSARHLPLSWARSIGDMNITLFSRYGHFCHKSNIITQHSLKQTSLVSETNNSWSRYKIEKLAVSLFVGQFLSRNNHVCLL